MSVPPPATFAEGQRKLYGFAAGGAGICMGLAVLVGQYVALFGAWPKELVKYQLGILAFGIAVGAVNTTIVIIGLLLGGPVGKFTGKVSDGTHTAEIDASSGAS